MKVQLTFKTPDVADEAIDRLPLLDRGEARKAIAKWVEFGEYLTVEIDTDEETCTVLPA